MQPKPKAIESIGFDSLPPPLFGNVPLTVVVVRIVVVVPPQLGEVVVVPPPQ